MPKPTIKVGMRVRDNDPRMLDRVMVVKAIEIRSAGDRAVLRHPTLPRQAFETRVAVKRIHLDDKPRRSGWSVAR